MKNLLELMQDFQKYRYVGTETDEVMQIYNKVLKEELKDNLLEFERYNAISASKVRALINEGKLEEASLLVPDSIQSLFQKIASDKKLQNSLQLFYIFVFCIKFDI